MSIIGVKALGIKEGGGITVLIGYIQALQRLRDHKYHLFLSEEGEKALDSLKLDGKKFKITILKWPSKNIFARLTWEALIFPFIIKFEKIYVLLSIADFLPPLIPKEVTTITAYFTMLPFTNIGISSARVVLLRYLYTRSLRKSSINIIPSIRAAENLKRFMSDYDQQCVVLPEPFSLPVAVPPEDGDEFLKDQYDIKSEYILYVSAIESYKNHINLILAYKRLKGEINSAPKLVLVGPIGNEKYFRKLNDVIRKNALNDDVIYLGKLGREELKHIYSRAKVYCQASFVEIFPLTSIEALSFGVPVVATNDSLNYQVLGNSALYFNPGDPKDIAEKLKIAIMDQKIGRLLVEKGKKIVNSLLFEFYNGIENILKGIP